MMKQDGIRPLISYYNRMEKDNAYYLIAGRLLKNITKLPGMTIHDVAALCFTSEATISRLAKKAGYDGFNALREQTSKSCSNYFTENRLLLPDQLRDQGSAAAYLNAMVDLLREMQSMISDELIAKATELIYQAEHIVYFGNCEGFLRFEQDLFICGKRVDIHQSFSDDTPDMSEWDERVLVLVDNPGYPWLSSSAVVIRAKRAGAKVLQISCTKNPEVEQSADMTLLLPGTKSGKDQVLFDTLVNILSIEYRRRYVDDWYYH